MKQKFISKIIPPKKLKEKAYWFIFQDQTLLVNKSLTGEVIPLIKDIDALNLSLLNQQYLGILDGIHCFVMKVDQNEDLDPNWHFLPLRQTYDQLGDTFFNIAGRALQILNWDINHQFCGRCATKMQTSTTERSKICPQCNLHNYPRLSPAVIVLVTRGDELLLARSPHFRPEIYSALAGFVEPGESIEETAMREVYEETKILIKNIRYVMSQSWPFPDSLMIALLADYESGEIVIDKKEIEDAKWYSLDNLPKLPMQGGIARKLIEYYLHPHFNSDNN